MKNCFTTTLCYEKFGGKANLNNVIEGKNTKLQHSPHLVNTVD